MHNTVRQHYVWARYLQAWTKKGNLWCLHLANGKRFATSPSSVANRRYFYGLAEMSDLEATLLREIVKRADPAAQRLHRDWHAFFDDVFARRREERRNGELSAARAREYEIEINNFEESYFSRVVEGPSVRFLDALVNGDFGPISASQSVEELQHFGYFLGLQYLRTPKIIEHPGILDLKAAGLNVTSAAFRHLFATHVGWAFASRRSQHNVCLLEASENVDFITCDQPAFNLHMGPGFDPRSEKFDVYYPLSPRRALKISFHSGGASDSHKRIKTHIVKQYNDFIARIAHEWIFAAENDSLQRAVLARQQQIVR